MQALEKTMRSAGTPKINPAHVQGEPGTGYEDENDLGEFECGNCYFYANDGGCSQAEMKRFSRRPRMDDGRVKRVGRKDEDD